MIWCCCYPLCCATPSHEEEPAKIQMRERVPPIWAHPALTSFLRMREIQKKTREMVALIWPSLSTNIYLLSFALLLIHAHLAHSEDYGSCNCTWYHQQSHNSATFLQPDTFPHSPAHLFVQLFRASLTSIKEDLIGGGGSQVMIPNSLLLYPEPLVRGGSRGSGDDVNPIHC